MTLARITTFLLIAASAAHAGAPAPTTPGLAGPYLSPPMPTGASVVDSAEMVPPVTNADPPAPPPPPAPARSASPATENVTVNLIQLMVKRGLLTQDDATTLIKQAQQEASTAHQAAATPPPTDMSSDGMLQSQPGAPAGGANDAVDVSYVPDVVRSQIRDEVTADVMQQARAAGLVTKSDVPDWVHRFHITGDVRTRFEDDDFPGGNAAGQIVNYNAINTGAPFDVNPATLRSGFVPTYNVTADRDRFRLRARIGADIDLGNNFTAGMRLGTGSDDQPVSENQTLGGVNSSTQNQGGNFSKYQIWLDRAFIAYDIGGQPQKDVSIMIGRFDNPFFSTSMIWADDIGFDGIAARGKYQIAEGVTPFFTLGAFPIFNTDLNFGTNSTAAGNGYSSEDKYLIAGQAGTTWIINKDLAFRGAVAFYDYENIQGKVSDPFSQDEYAELGTNYNGDTDDTRPSFAQHGNTYIALRNVVPDPALATPTPIYEYFGLASQFRDLAVTGQIDYSHFDPLHITVIGEFIDNLAFDSGAIENSGPPILPGPQNNINSGGNFGGGNLGYNVRLSVGTPALEKFGDWNVNLTYRYLESDATVDAFNDADFGGYLTGTNLQGYIIGGNLGIAPHVWTSLRFLSADSIAGPPLHTDTVQLDLNAKF
jgi:hypothetical protein